MNHPQQQDKQGGQQHRCKVPKCPYRHDHPQQEAQSITVKPDTASVSANRASAGNRSNQKLTEVSSELEPQQQERWDKLRDWYVNECQMHPTIQDLEAFISTERQRVLDEVRKVIKDRLRLPVDDVGELEDELFSALDELEGEKWNYQNQ